MALHRRWFVGIVVGIVVGVGALLGGPIGASLGAIAALLLAIHPPRSWPVGGLCLGLGGSWVLLLLRADLACGIDCIGPDLRPWYGVAVTFALLGAIVTLKTVRATQGPA